jgi:ribosomal protein S18 acetylase RimI-like enzyme
MSGRGQWNRRKEGRTSYRNLHYGGSQSTTLNDMVETLDLANRNEIVETFGEAFRGHPVLPRDASGRRSRLLATSILDAFVAAPDARVFGIRRDGRLDCAAFVFDADYEPPRWTLILFLFRMVRVVGLRMIPSIAKVLSQKPERAERRLELMVLGTRADCQRQGVGRAMVRHIIEFARGAGYQSVVLEAPKETPALGFYLSEGFVLEKELALPTMPLCLLRCPLTGPGVDGDAADGSL